MSSPLLVVFAGLPGTGKTTLASRLSRDLRACYLRVDVVEAALTNAGLTVGTHGYAVVHGIAASNLALGLHVVVDAVNPVPVARAGWREAASRGDAHLVFVETVLSDSIEHRRRVEGREPDIPGHVPPSWHEVQAVRWVPWDVGRDGSRFLVETSDTESALAQLLDALADLQTELPR